MQTFSPRTVAPYIVGRALLGFAQGLALPAAATYLSEMAPTRIRGRALSFYQLFYSVGSFIWYVDHISFSAMLRLLIVVAAFGARLGLRRTPLLATGAGSCLLYFKLHARS
jgi:MFS family permease